jgi:hypothetical protein
MPRSETTRDQCATNAAQEAFSSTSIGGKGSMSLSPSGNEPHVFQNTSDKEARMLVIAKPGGLENYFAELAEKAMNDPANVAALSAIGARYGITLLGPPIAARG